MSEILYCLSSINKRTKLITKWVNNCIKRSYITNHQRTELRQCNNDLILSTKTYRTVATRMIPNLTNDIIKLLNEVTRNYDYVTERFNHEIPSFESLIQEVNVVNNSWDGVDFKDGKLSIVTRNILLEHKGNWVDLGKFRICLNLNSGKLIINSLNKIESSGGFYHPHVKGGELCFGDGDFQAVEALSSGKLEDYFVTIETILNTYNHDSPHESLTEWYNPDHDEEFECDECGEWTPLDNRIDCPVCGGLWCNSCCYYDDGTCTDCGYFRCLSCQYLCDQCESILCENCRIICTCGHRTCGNCTTECERCSENICDECRKLCTNCDDGFCPDCAEKCECCGEYFCKLCSIFEACEECGKEICDGCQSSCNECQKPLCNDCAKNECEHCGICMCEFCEDEHNCILEGVS